MIHLCILFGPLSLPFDARGFDAEEIRAEISALNGLESFSSEVQHPEEISKVESDMVYVDL